MHGYSTVGGKAKDMQSAATIMGDYMQPTFGFDVENGLVLDFAYLFWCLS
jgi:hypothetical protein